MPLSLVMRRLSLRIPSMSVARRPAASTARRRSSSTPTEAPSTHLTRRSSTPPATQHLLRARATLPRPRVGEQRGHRYMRGRTPLLGLHSFHGLLVEGHLDRAPARHLGGVLFDHCCGATTASVVGSLWCGRLLEAARLRGSVGAIRGCDVVLLRVDSCAAPSVGQLTGAVHLHSARARAPALACRKRAPRSGAKGARAPHTSARFASVLQAASLFAKLAAQRACARLVRT